MQRQDGFIILPNMGSIVGVLLIIPVLLLTMWSPVEHLISVEMGDVTKNDVVVAVNASGDIAFDGRKVEMVELYHLLIQQNAKRPARRVFIRIAPDASHDQFMQVLVLAKRSALPISGMTADALTFGKPN